MAANQANPAAGSDARARQAAVQPRHHNPWWWLRLGVFLILLLLGTSLVLSYRLLSAVDTSGIANGGGSVIDQVRSLIANRDRALEGESQDRINVLLLGIGGEGHEGPYLADTIIVASLKPSTQQVALLSIPRDLAVEIGDFGFRKINSALALGREFDGADGGEQLMVNTVSQLTGLAIPYALRVDFTGFAEAIDALGGVSITVDQAFVDPEYPAPNFAYQTVRFDAGMQQMDGDTALVFARSRHGTNGEGSDFARAARQQKLVLAMKDRALSLGTLTNPKRITDVLSSLGTHTKTNLELWELVRLAKLGSGVTQDRLISRVLDTTPTGLLKVATGIDGAFLLVPRASDEREIRALAANIFLLDALPKEGARIVVENATGKTAGAAALVDSLETQGLDVVDTRPRTPQAQTIIYEFSGGQKPASLTVLRSLIQAQVTSTSPLVLTSANRASLTYENLNVGEPESAGADFLVILGTDALTTTPLASSNRRGGA